MFLLVDNFDSFTFNLVQAFQLLGLNPVVVRNNEAGLLELAKGGDLSMVCISPGPSHPKNAGLCLEFLEHLPSTVPVLGVCLGHQILGHFAGATVEVGPRIMHGKTSEIHHNNQGLFMDLPDPFTAGRYHSLLVKVDEAPAETRELLETTAWTKQGEVMGLSYRDRPWVGVQFHPESVLTPLGPKLLSHFPEGIL
ncbi:MAG: aminodeoxychorismate/anthranilate synthase component II [Thermodesulfobacteriota bacterium]|nr:aminodeoxychorismate/anthranilate synthase component II [Thermodesulfobacteriota bacterium]